MPCHRRLWMVWTLEINPNSHRSGLRSQVRSYMAYIDALLRGSNCAGDAIVVDLGTPVPCLLDKIILLVDLCACCSTSCHV